MSSRALVPNTVDWYVDQIVDLMCRGAWIRGQSRRMLAEKWGVSVSAVGNWAQIASKIVKSGTDEDVREEIKATSIEKLQILAAKAEKENKLGDATRSIRVLNEITGTIQGGSVVQVTVELGDDKYRVAAAEAAAMLSRAHAFFAERHPGLLKEFVEYVTGDTVAEVVEVKGALGA